MIGWAVTFLVVALVAAVLGFSGIAGIATNIAWICFVVGIILAVRGAWSQGRVAASVWPGRT